MQITKTLRNTTLSTAIALLLGAANMAYAQQSPTTAMAPPTPMTKADYKAQKDVIAADYKVGKAACKSLAANAKDICMATAKGKEKVAYAELEQTYQPSVDHRYKARVAVAEADYGVAREKCDDQAGNLKDVCIKEAKAAQTAAKADAKARMKIVDARIVASDKTVAARSDAAADKNNANYAVAIEKCAAFAGDAKAKCVAEAKITFGKN
jgi:hypothetical protein